MLFAEDSGKFASCVRCGGNWQWDYGDSYTGTQGENPGHGQGAAYGLPRQFPTL